MIRLTAFIIVIAMTSTSFAEGRIKRSAASTAQNTSQSQTLPSLQDFQGFQGFQNGQLPTTSTNQLPGLDQINSGQIQIPVDVNSANADLDQLKKDYQAQFDCAMSVFTKMQSAVNDANACLKNVSLTGQQSQDQIQAQAQACLDKLNSAQGLQQDLQACVSK